MDLNYYRIRRCPLNPLATTVTMSTLSGRRGPLRADHTINVTSHPEPSAKFTPKKVKDIASTLVAYRRKRTPSPHARSRSRIEASPIADLKRQFRRRQAILPLKCRSTDKFTEMPLNDCSDLPLFKDVNCIIRDECQDSPVHIVESSDSDCSSTDGTMDSISPQTSRTSSIRSHCSLSERLMNDSGISKCTIDIDGYQPAMYSPPRFLPYGRVDGRPLSPTSLPRHTSDTALLNLHNNQYRAHFSSMSTLNQYNDTPRCSSPEPIVRSPRMTPSAPTTASAPTTPRRAAPHIRGRSNKRVQRRPSLSEKLESIKNKAKTTMITIKRAVSSERLNRRSSSPASCGQTPSQTPSQSSAQSSVRSARRSWSRSSSIKRSSSKSRDSSRRRSKSPLRSLMASMSGSPGWWCSSGSDEDLSGSPPFSKFTTIGKLMAIHQDGTQTVLLNKSCNSSLPFSLTKCPQRGLIISGLVSSYPDLFYAGLVNVLDEIVEINNQSCHDLSLDQVYTLLQARTMVTMKTRPNLRRHARQQ